MIVAIGTVFMVLMAVLTGLLGDGAAGAQAIAAAGGCVLAQDPRTCEAADMPQAAIATGCVDFVLPLNKIAAALFRVPKMPDDR